MNRCPETADLIARSIVEDAPPNLNKMGVIRPGFSAELDGVMNASAHARDWVGGLEARERERTGINSLKVGYNKVFGYYIEITKRKHHARPGRLYSQANIDQCRALYYAGTKRI